MAETQKTGTLLAAPDITSPRERLIQRGDMQRLKNVQSFRNKKGTITIANLGEISGPKLSDINSDYSKQLDSLSASTMDGDMLDFVEYLETEPSLERGGPKRKTNPFKNPFKNIAPTKKARLDTLLEDKSRRLL